MKILPFVIIGLVGLVALGASIYIMKGSASHTQGAVTEITPPSALPPHPFTPSPVTADQNAPPVQTAGEPSPTISGSGQPPASGQGGGRMQRFYDQLGLSDAQREQIAQIRQTITDRQQRREAIKAVLTPDQQAKFDQMRAQFRNNRSGEGPGGPRNPGAPGGDNGQQGGNTAPAPPAPGT